MEANIGNALPKSCFLPGIALFPIRTDMLPKLRAVMSEEQIIAASNEEQPHLDRMRQITCKSCRENRCPHNFRYIPHGYGELAGLMDGNYVERIDRGESLLSSLISPEKKAELKEGGIAVHTQQVPSRKNPQIWILLECGRNSISIHCEVGRRVMFVNSVVEPFVSIKQLKDKIAECILRLS